MSETRSPKKENRATRCAKCPESFSYRYRTDCQQEENLIVKMRCPFCDTKLQVDLSPFAKKKMVIYKSTDKTPKTGESVVELPTELPTSIRE